MGATKEGRAARAVTIREDLIELTGDWAAALLLRHFIHLTDRFFAVDDYVSAEAQMRQTHGDQTPTLTPTDGWVKYRSCSKLADEIFSMTSEDTIRRRLETLVEGGWLERRKNPEVSWDHTYQYRVNFKRIRLDLLEIGWAFGKGGSRTIEPPQKPSPPIPQPADRSRSVQIGPAQSGNNSTESNTESNDPESYAQARDQKQPPDQELPPYPHADADEDPPEIPPAAKLGTMLDPQNMFKPLWKRKMGQPLTTTNTPQKRKLHYICRNYTEKEITEAMDVVLDKAPRNLWSYFIAVLEKMGEQRNNRSGAGGGKPKLQPRQEPTRDTRWEADDAMAERLRKLAEGDDDDN